ncbi:MAG: alpha/beta hydrolase [Kiloniellales bacterium]
MTIIGVSLGAYLLLIGGVFVLQRAMLYPAARETPNLAQAGVPGLQEVTTETADGLRLAHWYLAPAEPGAPVLVVFHGNAGHRGDRVPKLSALIRAGYGLLIAGYRGYGGNPGQPNESNLTADAHGLLDWLAGQGIAPARTVLYGESLGTGIAVKLGVARPAAAVILEAPYTSIALLAQSHYWYLPARWLVLDKWDSLSRIGGLKMPLLVIHGARDRTIPVRFGRQLFAAAPEPKEFLLLDQAGHNDLYDDPEVPARIVDFLNRQVLASR